VIIAKTFLLTSSDIYGYAMQKLFWKDSRLLEIFILSCILLILILFTVPYFKQFQCLAKQSEARMKLVDLYQAEKLYHATHQHYADFEVLQKLDVTSIKGKYYRFEIKRPEDNYFRINALGKQKNFTTPDSWSIDQTGTLKHTQNACPF
jgi:Tfp pilus assembly protein PilE